jgi:AraC family transcriptional regulator
VNAATITHFQARFQRVLDHIEEHPLGDLSLDMLSGIAAFSKFHFHRQFAALFGISVYRYVQLARLKRASYRLAFRAEDPVIEIALDSGYEGPEAFSRAFKQRFGQTPTEFRERPQWAAWHAAYRPIRETRRVHMKKDLQNAQVRIIEVEATRVAVLEHRGDPDLIGDSVRRFIAWRKEVGLPPKTSATFNILYDNPDDTPPAEFRLDLCAATDRAIQPNDAGIVAKTIPGGRCAVLRHVGSDDSFGEAARFLYAVWLPESGEEVRDFPLYCQRVAFFPDAPEHEAITDLFLPLT